MAIALLLSGCGLLITPQHRIAVARKDIKAGNWQHAAAELRTVIQGHPNDATAWQLLAQVSFDAGDIGGAQSSLQHAIAAGAKGPDLDALRLKILLGAGQERAVIAAITGHTVHASEPEQSLDLARAYAATGQPDQALAVLEPLLAQHPELTEGQVVRAEALVREGKLDEALQQLDAAGKRDPSSPLPPLFEGRLLAGRGQYAAAEQALGTALARMPPAQPLLDRAGALIALTEAQLAQGKVPAAIKSQASLAALVPGAPVTALLAGRIELAQGDLTAGINRLQGLVARAPALTEARLYLGAAQLAKGNLQQAQQQLEQVVQAAPDNVQARKLLATVRLRLGDPEAALSVLTPALETQPADPGLVSLLDAAGRRAGGKGASVQALERKLRADSKDQAAALNLARLQLATGDMAAAKSTLSAALTADPEALPVRLALSELLARTKDLPQALATLQAADKPGAPPVVKLAIARLELAHGDVKAAQSTLDQAIAAQPGKAQPVEAAGELLLAANQYAAALARFAQASVLQPQNPVYWLNSARAQLALNQAAAARESLDKAVQIRPDWAPAVGMLALMDLHAGNGQAALARVDALAASQPKDAEALALKGYVEAALGHSAEAIAAYTQSQTLHPTVQVAVQLFRARLASHQADPQQPLEDWLRRAPEDWRVHEILGNYYLGTGAWHPAAQQFEATIQQAPDNVVALNNLAWVYSKLDDPRAVTLAEQAYKLAPQAAPVADTLGWILVHRHEAAKAVPLLAQAVKEMPTDPDLAYHYAYALSRAGQPAQAKQVLTRLLATSKPFQSRAEAQRLLAALEQT